jgi:hypothetical protein
MSLKAVSAPVLNRREFVKVSDVVYWLDAPESVQDAQNALRDLGEKRATIWITPSDEYDPEVYSHDQRLVAANPIEPIVEELPVISDEVSSASEEGSSSSEVAPEPNAAENLDASENSSERVDGETMEKSTESVEPTESTPSIVVDEKHETTG